LNMSRQLATFARKMGDYERLVIAIATNDVPRVHALINTAIRNGASVNTITAQITEAVQGLRSTKGFTKLENDLSLLIYRLGGQSLLYSLNHALGLPSLRTIGNSANFVKVMPTIGPISMDEIRQNIRHVVVETRALAGRTGKHGIVVMMDEVAIEESATYFPSHNKVGGLCQKHSGTLPLTLQTYKSALTIVDALREGTVHFGKEMTLVAVKFSNEPNIYPILAAPTCKHETAADMVDLYEKIMSGWEEIAEEICGTIWNFSTDGDGDRRRAGYLLFCKYELPADDSLYQILSHLAGLNLCTGLKRRLSTFDWRHILKRDCTLIRQPSGMCCDAGRVVNPFSLAQCLKLLPDHDDYSVHKLLNPNDPQDVPRAIDLIEAIISLRDVLAPTNDVELAANLDSVRLLGHLLENLALPFITPELSLSEQIEMLSTYAHLSFVLFREYRLEFMSNQLYGDTQTAIKNIVFTVAKQQELDRTGKANANDDGTDPVEGYFAFMRMAGSHNSAMNYKQAVERTGWACDIEGVYSRWPHLQKESRRRKITRTEQKDHLNSSKWKADIISGNCDLIDRWRLGEVKAIAILRRHSKLSPEKYNFRAILKNGVDFLRPWGGNIYPGFIDDKMTPDQTPDRSLHEPAPS
ncbi:hypothetical protein B0H17DRAFT_901688, partial [Mycena rosella]